MSYFFNEETLYKKNYDMTLLRCVEASEAKRILEKVHEEVYGTHTSGHMMPRQALRVGSN